MDSYVVKVQNEGSIRRFTLAGGELAFSFEKLQSRIRELFRLPAGAQLVLTYIDKDDDVVTMGEDEDLRDALVLQSLNPLRVFIEDFQERGIEDDVKNSSSILQNDNSQERGTDDGVKISTPILQNEVNSAEGTKELQSIQGEQILPAQSGSLLSVDTMGTAEPLSDSGKSSALAEDKASTINGAPDSNSVAASLAAPGAAVDAKEVSPEGETKANGTPEAEVAKENLGHQIHVGVKCDGCGMTPIEGPRFQSLMKSNYDLCIKCFEASDAAYYEYARIDRISYRIGYPDTMCRGSGRGMCTKPHPRPSATPDSAPKNVNSAGAASVAEGENKSAAHNSTRVLHQGVQCDECGMVPIEGSRFNSTTRFNYDLCHSCFEKSGSNASDYRRIEQPFVCGGHPLVFRPFSRLASPRLRQSPLCGRWVMVPNQIVPILAVHPAGAAEEKTSAAAGSDVEVGGHPVDIPQAESAATERTSSGTPSAQVDADATATSASKQELGITEERVVHAEGRRNVVEIPVKFSTDEADTKTPAGVENVPSKEADTETPASVENVPSKENGTTNITGKTAGVEEANVQSPVAVEGESFAEEDLAAKLATMGFEDSKLNAELLEKNNFDLRKTVDDLCAAEEWDPILGELQEMGFYDANMNRRLMFKNNGSVKRVVKELVQIFKGEKLA